MAEDKYNYQQAKIDARDEEIKHLQWRLEQTEQRAEMAEQENKQLRNTLVEIGFDRFSKAEAWRSTANALASELEKAEQEIEFWKNRLMDAGAEEKQWIERTDVLKHDRNQLLHQLRELFEAVRPHANISKHVYRECEDTEQLLEKNEQEDTE